MTCFKTQQAGISLIELVTAIVIIGIVSVTLVLLTSDATRRSGDPLLTEQASGIAQAYIEEIQQKSFCDPDYDVDGNPSTALNCPVDCGGSVCAAGGCRNSGSGQEASRSLFDDVCDYDGLSDAGATDQLGNLIPGLSQYTVNVNVVDDGGATLGVLSGNNGEAVLVNVTVSHPAMQSAIQLSTYRTNF